MEYLIKKLVAASEGSPELDADIFEDVFGLTEYEGEPIVKWQRVKKWTGSYAYDILTPKRMKTEALAVLEYTTSLDAALTLVPNGWGWHVRHDNDGNYGHCLYPGLNVSPGAAVAATPPLALCLAALKARAAQ